MKEPAMNDGSFLPDFCSRRNASALILFAELFALSLVLAFPGEDRWRALLLTSLFVLWVAIGNAVVLCLARNWLARQTPLLSASVSYGIALAVTVLTSLLALALDRRLHLGLLGYGEVTGFILRNTAVSAIVSAVALRYFYVQHQWRRNVEHSAQARFEALQARIRPHFLFNSMNTIAALTRSRPEVAEQTIEDLAELFRISLGKEKTITLDDELDLTRRYLEIEKLRLGERLHIDWALASDLPMQARIPALILQPLVENAIYHGIEPRTDGGALRITGRPGPSGLEMSVENPLPPANAPKRSGNQMAQENVRQRLSLAYGKGARMTVVSENNQYQVNLTIPYSAP